MYVCDMCQSKPLPLGRKGVHCQPSEMTPVSSSVSLQDNYEVKYAVTFDPGLIKQRKRGTTSKKLLSSFGSGVPCHKRPCLGLNEKKRVTGGKCGQACSMYQKKITDK